MLRSAVGAMLAAFLAVQPAAASEEKKTEKRICKEEARIGSKIAKKVCRTAAEWKALSEQGREDQQALKEFTRRNSYGSR